MTRVLVTGGTGRLGRALVTQLEAQGATVRVLSRQDQPAPGRTEWVKGDLTLGTGLDHAFADVDVVVHSATSLKAREDLNMTAQVLAAAKAAGVGHVIYVSIVGIDTLGYFDYYAAKLGGERLFAASGLPYSVQRATQFHDFVVFLLTTLGRGPVQVVPSNVRLQPIDPAAVAGRLATLALGPAQGRLPDIAGPEERTLADLARVWWRMQGRRKHLLPLPLPLPIFRAMGSGQLVSPAAERLGGTWEAWLAQQGTSGQEAALSDGCP